MSKSCLQPHFPHREALPWHLWLFCENPASGINCFISFVSSDVGTECHKATPSLPFQSIEDSCIQHLLSIWSKKSVPCINWNLLISESNYSASLKMHESDRTGWLSEQAQQGRALSSAPGRGQPCWECPGSGWVLIMPCLTEVENSFLQ